MPELSPRSKTSILQRLRWRAVLLGFVTDQGASQIIGITIGLVVGFTMASQGKAADVNKVLLQSTTFLWSMEAIGAFFTIVGGFVAGRLAPEARYWNAAAVGLIDIVVGLLSFGSPPAWMNVLGIVITIPCALLGALLAGLGQPPPPPPIDPPQPGIM